MTTSVPCEQVDARIREARDLLARAGSARARRARALLQLGALLNVRYNCRADRADASDAVAVLSEAIALMPRQAAERVLAEFAFAVALCHRRTDGDIAQAIALMRQSSTIRSSSSLERALTLAQLGIALLRGYVTGGNVDDVNEAVAVLEEAHRNAPPADSPPRRLVVHMVKFGLACVLAGRRQLGAAAELDDGPRVRRLLSEIDVAALEEAMPGAGETIDSMRPGLVQILSFNSGGRLDLPADVEANAATPHPPAPPSSLLDGMAGMISRSSAGLLRMQSFLDSGGFGTLDEQVAAARFDVEHPHPNDPTPGMPRVMLAQLLHQRFRQLRMSGVAQAGQDLAEAIRLSAEAAADPDPHVLATAQLTQGVCLLDRYAVERLGSPADLDDALRLMHRGTQHTPGSRTSQVAQLAISEALIVKAWRDDDPADLDRAEDILLMLRERMRSGAGTQQIIAVRLAGLRMMRADWSGETEDVLRASHEARAATDDVAQVSLMWAYDAAAIWARWSRDHAPMAEQADAHQRVGASLYRLARSQLTRAYSEVALRRLWGGMAAYAAYALNRTERSVEAVVAAETGRAVLLSLALDTRRPVLPDTIDAALRERFAAAAATLAAAEADVLEEAGHRPGGGGGL